MDVDTKPELLKRMQMHRQNSIDRAKRIKELEAENAILKEKLSLIEPDNAIYFTRE